MSALNNQTNRNPNRYFFATSENGEQTLGLQFGTTGGSPNLSTMAVTISGSGGNGVIVNQAPSFQATDYIFAEEGMGVYGSTYFTPSTLATTISGISLSSDRVNGSGIACIEAYGGNGTNGGFEFLTRGVNSQLLSTTSVGINEYLSTLGRPGACAVLGASGSLVTNIVIGAEIGSTDVPSGGAGRVAFGINDLSGGLPIPRWGMGTTGTPAGSNSGSDFALFAYQDGGAFGSAPYTVKRSDGAMAIGNISSISATLGGTARGQVFPAVADNTEFGLRAGQLITPVLQVLFSTPVTNLNPNYQTMLNINWANSLSSGTANVNYKIGFSTATAYTNIFQTSPVPGTGGSWTPSDTPGTNTPVGHTNICCMLDSDGLDATGSGFLYVAGQLSDPLAANDLIWITKGSTAEPQRNALTYKTI
jgi:hypothetical protein